MKRKLLALLLSLSLLLSLAACGTPENKAAVKVAVLKGPTGMGTAWLMSEDEKGNTVNDYDFTVAGAADEITSGLVSGSLDIASIPTNLAGVLYNKTNGGITVLAVNTLGVLYVLERGDSIKSVSDLDGKKAVTAGQGSTAQYVLDYILEKNSVKPQVDYVSEHTEAVSVALSGQYDTVIVPEPFVTSVLAKDSSFRIALDLTEEWEKLGEGKLVMGAVAARTDFVNENPEAVKAFLEEYKKSVDFTNENIPEAAAMCGSYGIVDAAVAEKAIPNSHIVYMDGTEMADTMSTFLEVLYSAEPSSVGGSIPGDGFFYGV